MQYCMFSRSINIIREDLMPGHRFFTFFLSVLFAVFLPPPAHAEEADASSPFRIIHPENHALISSEMNHLVAKVKDERVMYSVVKVNEQITPVIDLSSASYKKMLKDFLVCRVYLLPGENKITLTVRDGEGKDLGSQELIVFYRDPFGAETSVIPERYARDRFHLEEKEALCRECHKMKADTVTDVDPVKKYDLFCVNCHEAWIAEGASHGTATWKCLHCHNYEGEPKYGLADEQGNFCVGCHVSEYNVFAVMTSIHADILEKKCLACHANHAAKAGGLLPAPVNHICFECHKKIYTGTHITPGHPLEALKDPSREGRAFDCTSCHEPHASNKVDLLKFEPGMKMCKNCHAK